MYHCNHKVNQHRKHNCYLCPFIELEEGVPGKAVGLQSPHVDNWSNWRVFLRGRGGLSTVWMRPATGDGSIDVQRVDLPVSQDIFPQEQVAHEALQYKHSLPSNTLYFV